MCGVLYFKGDSRKHKELIVNLLQQSRVRGLHAFGVSLRPTPEDDFQTIRTFNLPEAEQYIMENQFCELIGHCRYDTSGDWRILENNQPIVIGNSILAFNGVVRMSTREEYQQEFQQEYVTENDGEIPLRMFGEEDTSPAFTLLREERVSFAGVAYVNGRAFAVRNERRPLWMATIEKSKFIFSTIDIWNRAVFSLGQPLVIQTRQLKPLEVVWLS